MEHFTSRSYFWRLRPHLPWPYIRGVKKKKKTNSCYKGGESLLGLEVVWDIFVLFFSRFSSNSVPMCICRVSPLNFGTKESPDRNISGGLVDYPILFHPLLIVPKPCWPLSLSQTWTVVLSVLLTRAKTGFSRFFPLNVPSLFVPLLLVHVHRHYKRIRDHWNTVSRLSWCLYCLLVLGYYTVHKIIQNNIRCNSDINTGFCILSWRKSVSF